MKPDRWDICQHLYALNDMAYDRESDSFGETHTYSAECYLKPGQKCKRRGRCLIAVLPKEKP